mgnify:CR=1 FL=1
MKYPDKDQLNQTLEESKIILKFLDWLSNRGMCVVWIGDEGDYGDYIWGDKELVADYYNLNRDLL